MRVFSVALMILMSTVSFSARAWSLWEMNGAKMNIDGKDIRVASVNKTAADRVFHSKDPEFAKGVYVVGVWYGSSSESLPRSTALILDYLRSRGMKVVDKPDDSALAIKFEVGDLNIDGVTLKSELDVPGAKNLQDQGFDIAAKAATIDVIAKTSGAFAGAVAYAGAGGYHYSGDELTLRATLIPDPTLDKLGIDSDKFAKGADGVTARTAVKQSDPNTTTADLLTLMTKVWADKYFVKD